MTPEQFQKRLATLQKKIKKAVDTDLPKLAANEAARLFRKNFQEEGFFGKRWKEPQRKRIIETKTKKGKIKYKTRGKGADGRRKTLTGTTGDLGRSIRTKIETGKAIVYSDLKYSKAHNEGTNNAGRKRNVKLPKRQFIGEHKNLNKAIEDKLQTKINEIFKN